MKLEKLEYPEKHVLKMTFSATAEELETAAQAVYERTRDSYTIKGFEKGQADRAAIEAERGEHTFWYDAINDVMDCDVVRLMKQAAEDNHLETMGEPAYDLVSVKKEEGFVATATVSLKPELNLTKYTGFTAVCSPAPVTDKEIDLQVERMRNSNAELVSHKGPAVKGNIVIVDYKGTVDGVAFAGGEATNQKMTLGSGRMIPGFEEGILGHAAGDEFDIPVTFPANYRAKELAGKPAVFHMVLHDVCISQLPALNSDFAKKVGKVDTMEAYREQVRAQMAQGRHNTAMGHARTDIMNQLGNAAEGDLPSPLVEEEYNNQMRQLQFQLQMMHTTLTQYLQQTKQTKEEFFQRVRAGAEHALRNRLALTLVAEKENLIPDDDALNAELKVRAERAKKTLEEFLEKADRNAVRESMVRQAATDFVLSHSTIEDPQAPAQDAKA